MNGWRTHYEPWFQAWLVLAPIVGYGSYRLMQMMWRRTWAVMNGIEQSAFTSPPPPEDMAEPQMFVVYGLVAAVVFTVFWAGMARLYVNHSPADPSTAPTEAPHTSGNAEAER